MPTLPDLLTATLALDPATRLLHVSVATLPAGTACLALYRNAPGAAAQLLATVAAGADPGATLSARADTDGVWRLQVVALDAFAEAGQPAPTVLGQSAELTELVTLRHEAGLAAAYAAHAGPPRPPGAALALYLRKLARLAEAKTAWQEGDFYHAHAYLQS